MTAPCPEFGFVVRIVLRSRDDEIFGDLVRLLEANGLSSSEGRATTREYLVTREGTQATNADRELVIEWARRCTDIADVHVSDLVDLNER